MHVPSVTFNVSQFAPSPYTYHKDLVLSVGLSFTVIKISRVSKSGFMNYSYFLVLSDSFCYKFDRMDWLIDARILKRIYWGGKEDVKMIGQPKDYSEMLKRIFYSSAIVGILCTLSLGYISPAVKKILDSSETKLDIGPISLPVVAVAIPLVFALLTRMMRLHNRISDLLHIREKFDINHVIVKLAEGVNFQVDPQIKMKLKEKRDLLMRDVFYKYAPNVEHAVINAQLVSSAFDNWGWFWCSLEASVIILISAFLAWFLVNFKISLWYFGSFIICIFISFAFYPSCKRTAQYEVEDILNNQNRKQEIREVFGALQNKG